MGFYPTHGLFVTSDTWPVCHQRHVACLSPAIRGLFVTSDTLPVCHQRHSLVSGQMQEWGCLQGLFARLTCFKHARRLIRRSLHLQEATRLELSVFPSPCARARSLLEAPLFTWGAATKASHASLRKRYGARNQSRGSWRAGSLWLRVSLDGGLVGCVSRPGGLVRFLTRAQVNGPTSVVGDTNWNFGIVEVALTGSQHQSL